MKQALVKYGHWVALGLALAGLVFFFGSKHPVTRTLESVKFQPENDKLTSILEDIKVSGIAGAGLTGQDSLADALDLYGAANYLPAQQALASYLASHPEDKTARFYYGMTYLYLNAPAKALEILSPLSQLTGFNLQDDARWYTALAAANMDQVQALGLFSVLANDPTSKYQQAASAVMSSTLESRGKMSFSIEGGEEMKCSMIIEAQPAWWQAGWAHGILAVLFPISSAGLFFWQKKMKRLQTENRQMGIEIEASDALLHNILPAETAAELKQYGHSDTRRYEMVTVLFSDFQGFTNIAEQIAPEELVEYLGTCFEAYDGIITAHHLEKIKTVGDCYICAGGLSLKGNEMHIGLDKEQLARHNALQVISAGRQMLAFLEEFNRRQIKVGKPRFDARVGIHTGAVVAGIVGIKKYAYDIWGDTVNIAARMEQSSEAGRINISGSTYHLVKDQVVCIYRGKVDAKGKGAVDMYFVEG